MSTLNDALVQQVFKAMAVHKPQLTVLADLGDDDGEVDVRLLGDQVIRNFPWPVGIEVRRLLSGSMREPDRRRLDQLFRTFERSVQFLAFVMLAQLWKARKEKPFPLPASFVNEFQRRAPLVSLGNLTWMVRQIARVWKTTDSTWFVNEIGPLVTDKFCDELDGWVPERNEMGHYQVNLTAEEVQRRCVRANERLTAFLVKISFFAKYRLIPARDLPSSGGTDGPVGLVQGESRIKIDATSSPGSRTRLDNSSAVLLVKGTKTAQECLDLVPLVIDTRARAEPGMDGPDKAPQGDRFLFSKFRSGHIYFSGSEATERVDLSGLPDYAVLVEAFGSLLTTISGTSQVR